MDRSLTTYMQVREYRFEKAERGKRRIELGIERIRSLRCASCLRAALCGSAPSTEASAGVEQRILAAALEALTAIINDWGCEVDGCLPSPCATPAHCAHVMEDAAGMLVLASGRMEKLRRIQLVQDLPRVSRDAAAPAPRAEALAHTESSALADVIRAVSKREEELVDHDDSSSSSDHAALFDALYLCITACVKGLTSPKQVKRMPHTMFWLLLLTRNTCTHQRQYIGRRMQV